MRIIDIHRNRLFLPNRNTFIGGVGAVINTPGGLATKLGISQSSITNFIVIGVDVKCKISVNYIIPVNCFKNDTTITHYIDNDGRVVNFGGSSFYNSTQLRYIYFPSPSIVNITTGSNFWLSPVKKTEFLYLESTNLTTAIIGFPPSCVYYNVPLLASKTSMYKHSGSGLNAYYFNAPKVIKVDLRNARTPMTYINLNGVTEADSLDFAYSYAKYYDLENLTTSTGTSLFYIINKNVSRAATVRIPNLTRLGGSSFRAASGGTSPYRIYAPRCINYGDNNSAYTSVFRDLNGGVKIYIAPSMLTINAGGLEADLAYAQNVRGATLIPVTNFDLPNEVTNLTGGNITSSSVDLNFTAPTINTNPNDFYEVYIKEYGKIIPGWSPPVESKDSGDMPAIWKFHTEITNPGETISGLVSGKNYDIKIKTCDTLFNRANEGNTISITTL